MLQDDGIVEVVVGKGSPEVDTAIKGNCDQHAGLLKGESIGVIRSSRLAAYGQTPLCRQAGTQMLQHLDVVVETGGPNASALISSF